ncbi:hypothetical protein KP509_36G001600 [Ceratopteris richardii]|uniref:Phospholipid/glycerol acyltransferase domain-containing protein n=1 Tax=Ceratopteris richardii TaxID=49495 RepID=A0A8T2QA74_CERRI|nr:hypothetical protein KP509_36G001600 [Ceratopteris richardii]KAH7280536.1 hypothetical protein KP509_36G001600 [Ceratopteris richardii]
MESSATQVAAELEGWLLRDMDPFPYFFLVAMEAGSLIRAIAVLLAFPIAWLLKNAGRHDAALQLYVFVACAGLREADVEAVGQAVLPRFLAEDLRLRAWKTFSLYTPSQRIVISSLPRAMLHSFVRLQLGAQQLLAPELLCTSSGRCLGVLKHFDQHRPRLGATYLPKELLRPTPTHKYTGKLQAYANALKQETSSEEPEMVSMEDLHRPVLFHDGRIASRPTPAMALLMLLWMPLGFALALVRIVMCGQAPLRWWPLLARMTGVRVVVEGKVQAAAAGTSSGAGLLLVCNHRTLMDPIFVAMALRRQVTAATYSVSRLSEALSPIETVRLERDAERDLKRLRDLVKSGRHLVVCPEGTTSREALLLRFSALFAEVTDDIVPVAVDTTATFFHGNSARGFKALDPFFFMMNPVPTYRLVFLGRLPPEMTCGAGGRTRVEVANHVQRLIASTLGFQCSCFTRPDKYRFLAGTDGTVCRTPSLRRHASSKI